MKLKTLGIVCLSAGVLYGGESAANRLKTTAVVLTEIMATPDNGIPEELLEKSQCIVIVPGMKKGAFIVGAEYGRGFIMRFRYWTMLPGLCCWSARYPFV